MAVIRIQDIQQPRHRKFIRKSVVEIPSDKPFIFWKAYCGCCMRFKENVKGLRHKMAQGKSRDILIKS